MKKFVLAISTLALVCVAVYAQTRMSLGEAIHAARHQSVEALEARQAFMSTYWAYRSYKASRLPSFYLYGDMMNFDRSLTLLQNPGDGTLNYVSSNNLRNGVSLQMNQNITFTGGTLSVSTDLSRIDQFGSNRSLTWYSRPITVSYYQPLFTYNQFKWDRKIEPKAYEKGKRDYLEAMESITINVVHAYHNLMLAQMNNEISRSNFDNSGNMLRIAKERLRLGNVTKAEYLQLELRMLNDSISINETAVKVREAQMTLNSLLGYDESFEIVPEAGSELPVIRMDYELVMQKVLENSSFPLDNELALLDAESDVARAKASRGFSLALDARFGMSQTGPEFPQAYRNLLDQETVGVTFRIPVFDWGFGKGKVQKGLIRFVDTYRNLTRVAPPVRKAFYFRELAERVISLTREQAVMSGAVCTYEEKSENIILYADEGQISRILINLVKNALQADAHNISITAQLTLSEQTLINVANDGLPISRESQDEIFVPFYTTKPEGTGIGLSLSRQIMRLHNGSLTLARSDEEGTVFTLLFK